VSDAVIRLRDVSIELGVDRHRVLSGVDLDIRHGEVLAVVGRSGVGKSTLLRVVAGLIDVASGSIEYPDPVGSVRTALVFQDHRLMPWLSAIDNVAFPLRLRSHPERKRSKKDRRRVAHELLERLDIADLADRYPSELSGGQRQRVSIARAVAARPKVLLFDEPFSALDVATRSSLQDWIVSHRDSLAPTIVLVTHDLTEALYVADRIALLSHSNDEGRTEVPVWTSDVAHRDGIAESAVLPEIESHLMNVFEGASS
jgi:ABC-type nitrate/sulfonate/bicarbonate transport system ATPase subunit